MRFKPKNTQKTHTVYQKTHTVYGQKPKKTPQYISVNLKITEKDWTKKHPRVFR